MSIDRIERYLMALAISYEKVSEDVWIINDSDKGLNQIVLFVDETLLTLRTKVLKFDLHHRDVCFDLFKDLLTLNCDLLHGAYAIEDDWIILMDTLELATMDMEELQASLDAISLGLAEHYEHLRKYVIDLSSERFRK